MVKYQTNDETMDELNLHIARFERGNISYVTHFDLSK